MAHYNVSTENSTRAFRAADCDLDGKVSFSEFFFLAPALWPRLGHALNREAFREFDRDHDGSINRTEIEKTIWVSETEAVGTIAVYDNDGDMRISYGEFLAMVKQIVVRARKE